MLTFFLVFYLASILSGILFEFSLELLSSGSAHSDLEIAVGVRRKEGGKEAWQLGGTGLFSIEIFRIASATSVLPILFSEDIIAISFVMIDFAFLILGNQTLRCSFRAEKPNSLINSMMFLATKCYKTFNSYGFETGWWFGTFFIFPYWVANHPN